MTGPSPNGFPDLFEKCRKFVRARELQAAGLYPYFRPIEDSEATTVRIGSKRLIMVGSNNYLGLTHHPHVREAAKKAIDRYGVSCTGSRFLNGTLALHEELETRLAKFMNREAALTFSTGFQVNLGAISALVGKDDVIYCDRDNHASIIDGCRLSFGEIRKFKHNDAADLERMMASETETGGRLIVVDGVFSMFGDIADLPKLVALKKKFGARLYVDDAHSIGVLGEHGRGTAEHFHLEKETDLVMGTFSKSFASLGGFIAGDEEVIHYIKHQARSLIFSAAITAASAASALAALDIMEREPQRRQTLWKNAEFMRRGLRELGFEIGHGQTPVIPVIIGDQEKTFLFWKELFENGVFANPVTSPAVPPGKDLIRTSYMATHTQEQLEQVLGVFEKVGRKLGILAGNAARPAKAR